LLERLGIPFEARWPDVDEDAVKAAWNGTPVELVRHLARAKAQSVAEPDAVVIGSDQMAVLDGEILGKPGSTEAAVEQLSTLSGRTHELLTAVAVLTAGKLQQHLDTTRLTVRSLSREEIVRYVAADMPTDCAGSYKLESRGIALFESIESSDQTAIVGLPLIALTTILRNLGFRIP
jgi:septum formation protein